MAEKYVILKMEIIYIFSRRYNFQVYSTLMTLYVYHHNIESNLSTQHKHCVYIIIILGVICINNTNIVYHHIIERNL